MPDYRIRIVEQASRWLGHTSVRYVAGHPELGQLPEDGFDCSGFVRFILMSSGLTVPDFIGMDGRIRPIRHASEFHDHYGIHTHRSRPGDLIFFSRDGISPTHIGIVRDEESYIHAPGRDGTRVKVGEIVEEVIEGSEDTDLYIRNPIGYKSPTVPLPNSTYRWHQQLIE